MSLNPQTFAEARERFKPMKRTQMTRGKGITRKTSPAKRKASKRAKRKKVKSTKVVQSIFNRMVRERAGWVCVRCKRDCAERKGLLHASHFWGVTFTATRFDFDNVDALCYPCHYGQMGSGWEYCKQGDYMLYMIKKLGREGYDALERKARTSMKLLDAKLAFLATLTEENTDVDPLP